MVDAVCAQSLGIWCCNLSNVTSYPNSFLHVLEDRSLGTEAMLSAIQVDTKYNFQLWYTHVKLSPVSTISYCPFFVCSYWSTPEFIPVRLEFLKAYSCHANQVDHPHWRRPLGVYSIIVVTGGRQLSLIFGIAYTYYYKFTGHIVLIPTSYT